MPRLKEPRVLTAHELEVGTWLINNGKLADSQKNSFLWQLNHAKVISECDCGCASIDFVIEGKIEPKGALTILGDFLYGDNEGGIFVFEKEGTLAVIEVYLLGGETPRRVLPKLIEIMPLVH